MDGASIYERNDTIGGLKPQGRRWDDDGSPVRLNIEKAITGMKKDITSVCKDVDAIKGEVREIKQSVSDVSKAVNELSTSQKVCMATRTGGQKAVESMRIWILFAITIVGFLAGWATQFIGR